MKKKINILGSTGYIGKKTLNIIDKYFNNYKINFLFANNNYSLLTKQANHFKPNFVGILNKTNYPKIKKLINNNKIKIIAGEDCYEILKSNVDISILSISGISALKSIESVIKYSKKIGIVNKESIVSAGKFIFKLANKMNTTIIPLDSEHFSIYNFLKNYKIKNINILNKVYLTASGGPFLFHSTSNLKNVTLKQAINHPTWKMGIKNSVDSSTMINKCLEIIEAHYLFNISYKKLEIIIHPQSLVHSIIEIPDGSLILNMSNNDMSIPLYHSLSEKNYNPYNKLNINNIDNIKFIKPDKNKFKSLKIFDQLNKESISEIIIFNTSNEYAVNMFVNNKIKYHEITDYIKKSLNRFEKRKICNINEVIDYQSYVYNKLLLDDKH